MHSIGPSIRLIEGWTFNPYAVCKGEALASHATVGNVTRCRRDSTLRPPSSLPRALSLHLLSRQACISSARHFSGELRLCHSYEEIIGSPWSYVPFQRGGQVESLSSKKLSFTPRGICSSLSSLSSGSLSSSTEVRTRRFPVDFSSGHDYRL